MFSSPGKKILVLLIVITGIPVVSFLLWSISPKKEMEILIVNKTASSASRSEHKALFWILRHHRIARSNGKLYNHKRDYYGFMPMRPYRDRHFEIKGIRVSDIDSLAGHYDMAWFVDNHGVSFNDWYGDPSSGLQTRLIDGGLNQGDYAFIDEMLKRDKLVIAEFNFFANPTSDLVRRKAEELFEIYWSGWSGMWYDNLAAGNPDIPSWLVNAYAEHNDRDWNYSKPGIVLYSHDLNVVVLEKDTHLDIEVPLLVTGPEYAAEYGVADVVHFPYKFDISYAADPGKVVSSYLLGVNREGKRLLESHNIPVRFPASIANPGNRQVHFLAGNYSDYEQCLFLSVFRGIRSLDFLLYRDAVGDRGEFFRTWYYPYVSKVISDYYESIHNTGL